MSFCNSGEASQRQPWHGNKDASASAKRFLSSYFFIPSPTHPPAPVTPLPAADAARSRQPSRRGGQLGPAGEQRDGESRHGATHFTPAGRAGPRGAGLMPVPAPEVRPRRAALAAPSPEGLPFPASPARGGGGALGTHSWGWAPRLPSRQTGPESGRQGVGESGAAPRADGSRAGRGRGAARPPAAGTELWPKFWQGPPAPALPALAPSGRSPPLGAPSPAGPGGGRGQARRGSAVLPAAERPAELLCRLFFRRTLFPLLNLFPLPPASLRLFSYGKPRRSAGSGRATLPGNRSGVRALAAPRRGNRRSRRDKARPAGFAPDCSPDLPGRSSLRIVLPHEQNSRCFPAGAGRERAVLSWGWVQLDRNLGCVCSGGWGGVGWGAGHRRLLPAPQPDARFRVYFCGARGKRLARLPPAAPRCAVPALPREEGGRGPLSLKVCHRSGGSARERGFASPPRCLTRERRARRGSGPATPRPGTPLRELSRGENFPAWGTSAPAGLTFLKFLLHPSSRGADNSLQGGGGGRGGRGGRPVGPPLPTLPPRVRVHPSVPSPHAGARPPPPSRGGGAGRPLLPRPTPPPPLSPLLSPRSCQVLPVPPVRPKEPPDWAPGRAHVTPSVTSSLPVSFSCVLK